MHLARIRRLGGSGRTRLAAAAVSLIAVSVVGAGSVAQAAPAIPARFHKAPATMPITGKPLGLDSTPTTVVVQMAGDPVTVADAATPLTSSQRTSHRDALRNQQKPAEQRIRELGGTVLGAYQNAYNGIKVRIAGNKAASLLGIPNVVGVHKLQTMTPDNVRGVPLIGAPQVWDGVDGLHGEGVKIAVIDTGIDYTHADFGGPGTVAAYDAAHATDTAAADPSLFGPNAPKVKGGVDLVGDDYNADPSSPSYQPVPHPDSNPLDCAGHGSHVAGTATGFGVLDDGTTYRGAYDKSTVSSHDWLVGPGVAPKADLYSIRVFGCEGSTDVTVDAIEWAVDHDMDVINMSLGSPFGSADDPSAVAAANAAKDGVIVVASSGNSGQAPYMTGSPASGSNVISVAASDSTESNPGAHLAIAGGKTLDSIDANGAKFSDGTTLPVKVLKTGNAISLGCDPDEYKVPGVAGSLVVVQRGSCARVARAIFGQQAGAAAVLMVNNANTLPPYEGPITSNPDTGEAYTVTIPFFGVKSSDGAALVAADGGSVSLSNYTIPNPTYLAPADFTSAGPRSGDSWLKPDVTAPGVSIFSAAVGTGNSFAVMSGTSMASPHTAGMAALVRQAHPSWKKVQYWKAAIVNTADADKVNGYTTRVAGSGLVQAPPAVLTQTVALGDAGTATLNYGYAELSRDYTGTKPVTLHNFGDKAAAFQVGVEKSAGSPHTATASKTTVTVPARGEATVNVSLAVAAATAGDSSAFNDVAGLVTFTPVNGSNAGVALHVPYYMVPQATSNVDTQLDATALAATGSAVATTTNAKGAIPGSADWYAWGLSDGKDKGLAANDITAVGTQSFPTPNGQMVVFSIATAKPWSNASQSEYDVYVDVDGDGTDDYVVVGADYGGLTAGDYDGQTGSFVFDLRTGDGSIEFLGDAPFNSSTLLLPVLASQLCNDGSPCLSAKNPRITYHARGIDLVAGAADDVVDGTATYNAYSPALSAGMYDTVAPGASASERVRIDRNEWAHSAPLGLMVVTHDNSASSEAQLISVK
jgi:minor extracellular serine protease Vpr